MSNSRALENPAVTSGLNWDLYLDDNNRIARVTEKERIRQNIRERLQFFSGEWFLDVTAGVPWFERIFVKPANLALTQSILKQTIIKTNGVTKLLDFTFQGDVKNRVINVLDFHVDTIYGTVEESL